METIYIVTIRGEHVWSDEDVDVYIESVKITSF